MIQIHYDLSAGIKPAPPLKRRYAGVMGEVDGVEVTFTVPDAYADDAYRKRVEFVDVTGKLFTTDEVAYNELLMQSGTTLRLTLPWQWTVYGSTGFIRMVFYKTDDSDAVTPLEFTPQFPLYFDTTEEANDKVERRSLAQLIVDGHGAVKNAATASSNANQAANAAAAAAEQARSVAINIETAKDNGQFDGADGADGVSVQHVNIDPGTQHLIITLSNGKIIDAGELPKGEQGVSVASVAINENGHLIVTLSDGEKLDAGEIPGGEGGGAVTDAVLYTEQELTESQQAQARTNIGAQPQTLIVRFDTSNLGYATHNAVEISGHVTDGGDTRYYDESNVEYALLDASATSARFYRDVVSTTGIVRTVVTIADTGAISTGRTQATIPTVPTALPNPNALTFTGAVEGAYDGSKPLTVNIPEGGEGGTKEVYVQTEEPTDAPDGSIWVNPDGESPESGSGGGAAKTEKLLDVTLEEATASVSVTLEHNFHRLFLVWSNGESGAARLVDADGAAVSGRLSVLLNTTTVGWNSRLIGAIVDTAGTWKTDRLLMEWTDDVSTFISATAASIQTGAKQTPYELFGGTTAMVGTLGTSDALSPVAGTTVNIISGTNFFSATSRIILVGEYYE